MSEKKKGLLGNIFKSNGSGCGCGVTIVEEKKTDGKTNKEDNKDTKK